MISIGLNVHTKYLCGLFALALLLTRPATSQSPPRIAGFQAYLFNSRTGQLSSDVLAKDSPSLGNVPAGEYASVSTLVVVRVEFGPEAAIPQKSQIRLVAVENGSTHFAPGAVDHIILDKTAALGPVSDKGTTYVGFWLANTGCLAIKLKASVVGARNIAPALVTLPFACYE